MDTTRLKRLLLTLEKSERDVVEELQRLYPMDSRVRMNLRYGQITPSEGVVFGHRGGRFGCVAVKLTSSPKQIVRDVAYKNIER